MPRARVPLTFGPGLDRATGTGARDARTLTDARNLIAREAGLELRTGLSGSGLPALTWGTDILAQQSVERTRDVLQVIYDRPTRELRVFRVNPVDPPTRQQVAVWGTLNASAKFPIITMAEAGGVVYMAHAEDIMAYRLVTKYWTPGANDTDTGTLTTASADFDGSGAPGDISFYGVCAYREYIAGWGWGTEAASITADRPEIVRLSKPDDPTVFPAELYFLCGSRSTRVIGCTPMPTGLLVASSTQRYTIFGTDPETFGVELTDPSHGIVSPRAWQTINGVAYTWASTGPRVTRDPMAPSEDLALPLDLMEAQPDTWPARGPAREAFAAYEPEQRVLYWVWPDLTAAEAPRTMAYACSLRLPSSPRFTPAVFERRLASAGRYVTGKVPLPTTVGGSGTINLIDLGWFEVSSGRTLRAEYTFSGAVGNETVEIWLKTGSTWALHATQAYAPGLLTTEFTGLDSLTSYSVAVRLRSFLGAYGAGFTGSNPDLWTDPTPANWRATLTTGASTPTLSVPVWSRTSNTTAPFTFDITGADARCPVVIEQDTGAGYTEVATVTRTGATLTATVNVHAIPGQTPNYRARHKRGVLTGSYSGVVSQFVGLLDVAPGIVAAYDISDPTANLRAVELFFRLPQARAVQVEFTDSAQQFIETAGISTQGYQYTTTLVGAGTVNYRLRVAREQFGVYDFGPWGTLQSMTVNPAGATPGAITVDDQNFLPNAFNPSLSEGNFGIETVLVFDLDLQPYFLFYRVDVRYFGTLRFVILGRHPSGRFTLRTSDTGGPVNNYWANAEVLDGSYLNPSDGQPVIDLLGARVFAIFQSGGSNRRGPYSTIV